MKIIYWKEDDFVKVKGVYRIKSKDEMLYGVKNTNTNERMTGTATAKSDNDTMENIMN